MSAPFIDTNIAVYAISSDPKNARAKQAIAQPFQLSVQTLNEFAATIRRKRLLDWHEMTLALEELKLLATELHPVTRESHEIAIALAERYDLHIYDANQLAVALIAGGKIFLSEDMQHGMVIADQLTILNPFIQI